MNQSGEETKDEEADWAEVYFKILYTFQDFLILNENYCRNPAPT